MALLNPSPRPINPAVVPYWQRLEKEKREVRRLYFRLGWISPREYAILELRYNENRDPDNGRYTFGPGGSGGKTAKSNRGGIAQLKKSVRSLNKRICEHQEKLAHPEKVYPDWESTPPDEKQRKLAHWQKEIDAFQKGIDDANVKLRERGVTDD